MKNPPRLSPCSFAIARLRVPRALGIDHLALGPCLGHHLVRANPSSFVLFRADVHFNRLRKLAELLVASAAIVISRAGRH